MPILHANLLVKLAFVSALPLALNALPLTGEPEAPASKASPAMVALQPGQFSYRPVGDFSRDGRSVDADLERRKFSGGLDIMKTQVSAAAYDECVRDKACRALADRRPARPDHPAVAVSWEDATAYARWLSAKTGESWRLPTDEEWVYAAGSRFVDDAVGLSDSVDFSERWLAKFTQGAASEIADERAPRVFGAFGANEHGLLDVGGNVWEWTNACFVRRALDGPADAAPVVNCGVRLAEGRHRAFVSNFVRDARKSGCAVGAPPANLGFRLVRERRPAVAFNLAALKRWVGRVS